MSGSTDIQQIKKGKRLGTMLLDHVFMTFVMMIFFIPGTIADMANAFKITHEETHVGFMTGVWGYISLIGLAIYFCKDCFHGRSIAKRILKLQIVNNSTGQVASPLRCFVRNMFLLIWPIEGVIALINPGRRLGDIVAGTKLVAFDRTREQPKVKMIQVVISAVLSVGLIFLIMLPFGSLKAAMNSQEINYVKGSFNQRESTELEQLLNDSLGEYLTSDIRIYDKIRDTDLKYISVILQLKENYLEDESSYKQLNSSATILIYSSYPKETFTGKLKFFFKEPGHMQSRGTGLGTEIIPK